MTTLGGQRQELQKLTGEVDQLTPQADLTLLEKETLVKEAGDLKVEAREAAKDAEKLDKGLGTLKAEVEGKTSTLNSTNAQWYLLFSDSDPAV